MEKYSYAKSGVDIHKEAKSISSLISQLTYKRVGREKKIHLEDGYSGLIDFGDRAIAITTDGVGTKILIAELLNKWDTIGIDCVAMNVNDLIAVGAEPIAMVDYIAAEEVNEAVMAEIGVGLNEGARQANIDIVGGETATLKGIVTGLDIAGTAIGVVDKDKIITGSKIQAGDVVIGIESSGVHSNGYTLARKVLFDHLKIDDPLPSDPTVTVGAALLTPTRIYVNVVLDIIKNFEVLGLAHITGSGFLNLSRLKDNVGFSIDTPPTPHPIFRDIMNLGSISEKEMYSTFNMGVGFCIICKKSIQKEVIHRIKSYNIYGYLIGTVTSDAGVVTIKNSITL